MPRYEYKCEGCGEHFEVQQKFADEPLSIHDKCGGKVERLISVPSLQFKGTGWYVTDYAKGGNGGAKKSESEPKKESKPSGESSSSSTTSETKSTESKPAPAASDKPKTD
jgi:putative FmdB family regulatory protein